MLYQLSYRPMVLKSALSFIRNVPGIARVIFPWHEKDASCRDEQNTISAPFLCSVTAQDFCDIKKHAFR